MISRLLMRLQVVVPPPQRLGAVPHGTRVIAPITSGTFEGPRLRGKVLPGGGDWTLLRPDGVLELEATEHLIPDTRSRLFHLAPADKQAPAELSCAPSGRNR